MIEATLAAVNRFKGDQRGYLTLVAGGVLHSVSYLVAACERLMRAGAATLMATAAPLAFEPQRHDANRCSFIRNVAAAEPRRAELMRIGAPATVMAMMRRCSEFGARGTALSDDWEDAVAAGCGAIRNLAMNPAHRVPLMAAGSGCADAVVAEMTKHKGTGRIAWAACGAVYALSCEPANCAALCRGSPSAITAVRHAIQEFPEETAMAWAVSGIILNLAAHESLHDMLVQRDKREGVAEALVAILYNQRCDRPVVRAACQCAAARRLAAPSLTRFLLAGAGARAAIEAALRIQPVARGSPSAEQAKKAQAALLA